MKVKDRKVNGYLQKVEKPNGTGIISTAFLQSYRPSLLASIRGRLVKRRESVDYFLNKNDAELGDDEAQ